MPGGLSTWLSTGYEHSCQQRREKGGVIEMKEKIENVLRWVAKAILALLNVGKNKKKA